MPTCLPKCHHFGTGSIPPTYSCLPHNPSPIMTPLLRYERTRVDLSGVNLQSNSKGCRLLYSCAPKYVCCCVSSLVFGCGVWTRVYKAHRCRIVGSMRRPPRAPLNEHEPCGLDPTNMRSETHRCRIVGKYAATTTCTVGSPWVSEMNTASQ